MTMPAGLTAEQRALCLAARTRPADEAGAALEALLRSEVRWDTLWDLAHLHEVVPLVGANVVVIRRG